MSNRLVRKRFIYHELDCSWKIYLWSFLNESFLNSNEIVFTNSLLKSCMNDSFQTYSFANDSFIIN